MGICGKCFGRIGEAGLGGCYCEPMRPPPVIKPRWTEENGVIRFTLVSDGTTGPEWVSRFRRSGWNLSGYAKEILSLSSGKPERGAVRKVAVIRGSVFRNWNLTFRNIRVEARRRRFFTPDSEIACLMASAQADGDFAGMRLRNIVTMCRPRYFVSNIGSGGHRRLCANLETPLDLPSGNDGYAFVELSVG